MLSSRLLVLALLACLASPTTFAQDGAEGRHSGSTYQRSRWENESRRHRPRHHARRPVAAPQVQSGWFQRPYPYHLDYYRMRYGGNYDPYFGNLYGPPNLIFPQAYPAPYFNNFYGF